MAGKVTKAKKAISICVNVIIALFLVLAIVALVVTIVYRVKGEDAELFGYQFRIVVSGSMEPEIPTGSVIAVRTPAEGDEEFYADLKVGDVLTFYWFNASSLENVIVTHRIVAIEQTENGYSYTMQGDAVENDQQIVTSASGNIIGKVEWDSLALGNILTFLRSAGGIVCCLIVPAAVVICFEAYRIFRLVREGKAEKKKSEAIERDEELERLRRELEELKKEKENRDA